jgi:dUTP pyrophosphatase
MKIKIKYHKNSKKIKQNGDWIDLFPRKEYVFKAPKQVETIFNTSKTEKFYIVFDSKLIDLGVSMKLPKYFEANIVPRSSTFMKQGLIQGNHFGVIDTNYSGEQDIWKFPAIAMRKTVITPDKAICQFRIQPTMNAPWYIKLKWLFTSKIKFVEVDVLQGANRGGFGSTDKI